MTVEQLVEMLTERQTMWVYICVCVCVCVKSPSSNRSCSQIKKPSLATSTKHIYLQGPPQLEQATRPNLEKKVSELVEEGDPVIVTASTLPFDLSLVITYT